MIIFGLHFIIAVCFSIYLFVSKEIFCLPNRFEVMRKSRHLAELKGIKHFQGVEYDEIEEKVFLSMHVRSCLFGGFIWEIILVCAIIAGLFWCIFKISELIENQIVRFFQFAERLFTRNKS